MHAKKPWHHHLCLIGRHIPNPHMTDRDRLRGDVVLLLTSVCNNSNPVFAGSALLLGKYTSDTSAAAVHRIAVRMRFWPVCTNEDRSIRVLDEKSIYQNKINTNLTKPCDTLNQVSLSFLPQAFPYDLFTDPLRVLYVKNPYAELRKLRAGVTNQTKNTHIHTRRPSNGRTPARCTFRLQSFIHPLRRGTRCAPRTDTTGTTTTWPSAEAAERIDTHLDLANTRPAAGAELGTLAMRCDAGLDVAPVVVVMLMHVGEFAQLWVFLLYILTKRIFMLKFL